MALKSNSIGNLTSNRTSTPFKDIRTIIMPSLMLLLIPTLFILAFGTLLSNSSTSAQANATFSLNTSGALTLYLNEADVTCTANGVNFNIAAQNGLSSYQLNLAAPASMNQLEQASIMELNQASNLNFALVAENGMTYRNFAASKGEASISTSGKGHISAILSDSQGQQLFINSRWTCPVS